MRFWCVPSATDLESPKLPPRINRDVYLRSPPPPPRLSREEKMARGVMREPRGGGGATGAGDSGSRVHRKKKRRKRKVAPNSSTASAAVASLAAGSSGSMSDLNQYARLPPLPEGYSSLQTRKAKGARAVAPSASAAGKVLPRAAAHHERSASMGELSTFRATADQRKNKGRGSSSKAASKASKSVAEGDLAELPPSGDPNLVLHPGKSRSRERKNKLRKKGKTYLDCNELTTES